MTESDATAARPFDQKAFDDSAVAALPHTRTGMKLETPLTRILQGAAPSGVLSLGAVDRPELIDFYVELGKEN